MFITNLNQVIGENETAQATFTKYEVATIETVQQECQRSTQTKDG